MTDAYLYICEFIPMFFHFKKLFNNRFSCYLKGILVKKIIR